jgi:hypothetical protein
MAYMSLILGIDPGFTGALALYDSATSHLVAAIDMPLAHQSLLNGPQRPTIDASMILCLIRPYQSEIVLAVLEKVSAMPGQGVSSMFRFGEGFGVIQGIIHALNIRLLMPPPAVWKSQMKVTADKKSSLAKVRKEFPEQAHIFARQKDNGRAEALLLAMFGARSLDLFPRGRDEINAIL